MIRGSWGLRPLRAGLVVSAAVLLVSALVAWLVAGRVAAAGAAAGVALAAASFTVSTLVLAWANAVHPQLLLPVGLTLYAVKFTAIGLLMAAIAESGWQGLTAMGVMIIIGVLGWTLAMAWWSWRDAVRSRM